MTIWVKLLWAVTCGLGTGMLQLWVAWRYRKLEPEKWQFAVRHRRVFWLLYALAWIFSLTLLFWITADRWPAALLVLVGFYLFMWLVESLIWRFSVARKKSKTPADGLE